MKSILTIRTQPAENPDEYVVHELWNEEEKVFSFSQNMSLQTARIEFGAVKRVFVIDKAGNTNYGMVLQNEYGIELGNINYNKKNINEGRIEINNEHFNYQFSNETEPELKIYSSSKIQPLLIKGFSAKDIKALINTSTKLLSEKYSGFIMSLCLFLLTPFTKQTSLTNTFTA